MIRCVLSFSALALLAAAQAPDAEVVSLVAVDRQGQTVGDLKAGEVQVFVDGKPRKIASLQPAGAASSATVILYDLLNTTTASRGTAPPQIVRSLEHAGPNAAVYLYLVTADGKLYPARGLNAAAGADRPDSVGAALDDALHNVAVTRPAHLDRTGARVKATYTVLAELSNALSTRPGRKSIVWITHGVPLHGTTPDDVTVDYLPTLKKLAATLGMFSIVLYPVDQTASATVASTDSSIDTLRQFAAITGGRVFPNDKVEEAAAGALRDTAASYLLAYAEPAGKRDGKFHHLRVSCTRTGVRIQVKQGYYADR